MLAGFRAPRDRGRAGISIAGHRDGFFRALKDIKVGDAIELQTETGREAFVVRSLSIVNPSDISVLLPTAAPTMTLVTCYPFYFVGSAPQRFIVTAETPSLALDGV